MVLDHVKPGGVARPRPNATRWSASGTARPPHGCSRSKTTTPCISIAPARCFPPIRTSVPERFPARNLCRAAHSERRAIRRSAVRRDVRRRVGTRRAAAGRSDSSGVRSRSSRTTPKPGCGWAACWGCSGGTATPRESSVRRWRRSTKTCCAITASCFWAPRRSRWASTTPHSTPTSRAAALYPAAQSPWLALSSLGRRRGDRRRRVARAAAAVRPALDRARAR